MYPISLNILQCCSNSKSFLSSQSRFSLAEISLSLHTGPGPLPSAVYGEAASGRLPRCLLLRRSNRPRRPSPIAIATIFATYLVASMSLRNLLLLLLCWFELSISAVVHFVYGASILSSAVVADLFEFLSTGTFPNFTADSISGAVEKCTKPNIGTIENNDAGAVGNGPYMAGPEDAPIVLVHGIFGFGKGKMGSLSYWAGAEKKDARVLSPDLGPLTSIHDRARELFYYLKGGSVDYGLEHSRACGHSRFGRTYGRGHYPEWDEDHPVHFVGHSTGAQVVRVLQQMLSDKKFEEFDDTNADWVLSLTSLSGVLNGSTRIYLDGIRPENGKTCAIVSLLQLLRLGVVLYEWLDIPVLKRYYGFGFDHFPMSWRQIGLTGLVKSLLIPSGPFASCDWICPDLSIQSAMEFNRNLKTFPNTYYFSIATTKTRKFLGYTVPLSVIGIHPLLFVRALQMCQWRHPSDSPPPYQGYRDEDWHDNDGALNTISMLYPRFPDAHPHSWLGPDCKDSRSLQTGIWYYYVIEGDHIFFIINRERAGIQFDLLYTSIFQRCRKQMKREMIKKAQGILHEDLPLLGNC